MLTNVIQDFFDWRPSSTFDNRRIKKGNQEKEQDKEMDRLSAQGGPTSLDSSPPADRSKRHTPATFPRTKLSPLNSASQRRALEELKQQLLFSDADEVSCTPITY